MDYQIQNTTAAYLMNIRTLFTEECKFITKELRAEIDAYITIIESNQKKFIDAINSNFDKSECDKTDKYMS